MATNEQFFLNRMLNRLSPHEVEQLFYGNVDNLIQSLVHKCLAEKSCSIGISYQGTNHWSILSLDEYDSDTEISLRFSASGYDLLLSYYSDEEEDFVQLTSIFTLPQLMNIPGGILTLLKKAWTEKKECTLKPGLLSAVS